MSRIGRSRLAVLISGRGSNLQALCEAIAAGTLDAEIVAVGCDRADAPGLEIARKFGIPQVLVPRASCASRAEFESRLFTQLEGYAPDWLVLAGFMRVLSAQAVARWPARMINLHPSLLPRYPGLDTHARALAAGDREHGASVHLVTAELDGGPVLAQVRLKIQPDDNPERLAERLRPLEHRLLLWVCSLLVEGRLLAESEQILIDGEPLRAPLLLN